MPRYKLTIAYDGTGFCGWQKQEPPPGTVAAEKVLGVSRPPDPLEDESGLGTEPATPPPPQRLILRTVQEVVERAVREVVRERIVLMGASRTDSGVHARGQVAAFTCGGTEPSSNTPSGNRPSSNQPSAQAEEPSPPRPAHGARTGWPLSRGTEKLILAINSRLPEDVIITAAEPVPDSFNPISDCTAKGYSYTLHVSRNRPLWDRNFVHHVWSPLDVAAMNDAAGRFVGEHDFAAFAAAGHGRVSTVRTVFECRVEEETGKLANWQTGKSEMARRVRIDVSGNGFLWNMVRIMSGTLLEVGLGRMRPEAVTAAIQSKDRRNAGPTLPATGLCLEWIRYDGLPSRGSSS